MRILVTGATGFIGKALFKSLSKHKRFLVRGAIRKKHIKSEVLVPRHIEYIDDIGPNTCWDSLLKDVHIVVHTAGRAHIMKEASVNELSKFRTVNVAGTLTLARQAAEAGVSRFIFLSSVKVNGEETALGKPLTEDMPVNPTDAYAISKKEAEEGLCELANKFKMDIVIIRPPLVYGPGVKANFLLMMNFLTRGLPLPFGAIHNLRSMVSLENLIDLIITCIDHPRAANQVFFVSDDEDVSTTELLIRLKKNLNSSTYFIPLPQKIIELCLVLSGRKDLERKLIRSLQVDICKAKRMLGWHPPVLQSKSLEKTAKYFKDSL